MTQRGQELRPHVQRAPVQKGRVEKVEQAELQAVVVGHHDPSLDAEAVELREPLLVCSQLELFFVAVPIVNQLKDTLL